LRQPEPREAQNLEDPLTIWNDDRVIILELFRPNNDGDENMAYTDADTGKDYWVDIAIGDNSDIVSFSPALSAVVCCNTCVEFLGTEVQAKSAMFYLVNYITKEGNDLTHVLGVIQAAHANITAHPSVAEDTGTMERTRKHFISRIINSINGEKEAGGQMAALAALRFPSNIYSHEFTFCFIQPAIQWALSLPFEPNDADDSNTLLSEAQDETLPSSDDNNGSLDLDTDTLFELAQPGDADIDVDLFRGCNAYEGDESVKITHGPNGALALQQFEHYRYRGAQLSSLSFYVWSAVINVLSKSEIAANVATDRHPNAHYDFDSRHPLAATHTQRLRLKSKIPMLAGASPPMHPGKKRSDAKWKRKADAFAAYVITLHKPWSVDTLAPDIALNWNSFQTWVQHLDDPGNLSYIDKARLFWMRNLSCRSIKASTCKLIASWRGRCAHFWSKSSPEDQDTAPKHGENPNETSESGIAAQLLQELRQLYEASEPNITKEQVHVVTSLRALEVMSAEANHERQTTAYQRFTAQATASAYSLVESNTLIPRNDNNDSVSSVNSQPLATNGNALPAPSNDHPSFVPVSVTTEGLSLNTEQQAAFTAIVTWFNEYHQHIRDPQHRSAPNQLKLLIHGPAGTGKSFLVQKLVDRLGIKNIATASYTGVAASNLPQGKTLNSTFSIPYMKRTNTRGLSSNPPSITSTAKAIHNLGEARIVIIDEISLTSAPMLNKIEKKLRDWYDGVQPFGGLAIVAMGDFFQIPCVGAKSLVSASLDAADYIGRLFNQFTKIDFNKQERAAEDVAHVQRLMFFRQPSISTTPVKASKILDHLKPITRADVESDPKWLEAAIIVPDNYTRKAFNKAQILRFAKQTNQPVLAFRFELSSATKKVFDEGAARNRTPVEKLLDQYDDLTFYFAAGAPAVLKSNIGADRRISNGSMCRLHSLTFNPSSMPSFEEIANAPPGCVHMLSQTPLSINIIFPGASIADWPTGWSLSTTEVVIPMMQQRSEEVLKIPGHSQLKLGFYNFNVDLAFAVTFHKVQGRTLDRVIIDLNSPGLPKITCASLYVAISRVRLGKHLRLLAAISPERRNELMKLEFKEDLLEWLGRDSNQHT